MDRNEVMKMEELLQTKKGEEYVLYMLKYPSVRNKIAEILADNRNYCIIETVEFLEFIMEIALGNDRIVPKTIEDKCSSIKKYSASNFKFCRNEIFDMLIVRQEGKDPEKYLVPMFALLDFEKLQDPGSVCEIIDSISDIAMKYKSYTRVESLMNYDDEEKPADDEEIFDEDMVNSEDALCEYLRENNFNI